MTCRRPTISVQMEVLERLARANSDAGAPDSQEFTPMSWRELDRDSLSDGLTDLLAAQAERVRQEQHIQIELLCSKAEARARQEEDALRWERALIERKRAERLLSRIEDARARGTAEAQERLEQHQAVLSTVHRRKASELAYEEEAAKADVIESKKHWVRTSQLFLAAAALVGVVWVSALGQARANAGQELAQAWQDSKAEELAAETRVAELEAEIDRYLNLSESERASLENELDQARASLDVKKKEREELDRRRPAEGPSKMARNLTPLVNSKAQGRAATELEERTAPKSERVATDVVVEGCSSFDPLCFDL